MMKTKIFAACISLLLCACNGYLDESPDSAIDVDVNSEDKIAEMLTGAYPDASYFEFLETRTDNVTERVNGIHNSLNEAMYYWVDYDQEDLDTPLNYWNACYAGIAQANKALELLAAYPKTPRVKALYGEAFLLRAYLHFMLVNIWAEPYGSQRSTTSPGIPYLTKPEKHALVDYKRGTVADVYEKIEKDLLLGITLVDDSYYTKPKFHFTKQAACAFASRFYLMYGKWDKVVEYANYVLGRDPGKLLRNWTEYSHKLFFNHPSLYTIYTSLEEPANIMLTVTESRQKRNMPTEKYGLTYNLMQSIFDKKGIEGCSEFSKDLNLSQQGAYTFSASPSPVTDGRYMAKFDELSLYGYTGSKPRGLYVTNVLFSVEEVLFNRMEAYAMQHDYVRSIDDLLIYLRSKFGLIPACGRESFTTTSVNNYTIYKPFYGLSIKQLALVKTIVDFRQKEFLHEGLRWFDIRRFYLPVSRSSKNSLYRPLTQEDPRKLLQIPTEAIRRGLEPNTR
uniref:RagB/SusD family nutrient uptake outer membrane protein n=1 Tax=Prevotella sp. GTC17259 TaxID=3236795 RepID=A0AB33J611_9BACT